MILANFIGHCRDSIVFAFWWRRRKKREKEEMYVRPALNCFNSTPLEFPWPTRIILQGNQNSPCVQAHAFATITMYSWWQPSEIGCAYQM